MYQNIVEQSKNMIEEFLSVVPMNKGEILVVGCSSSEIVGSNIGKGSSFEAAKIVFEVISSKLAKNGIFLVDDGTGEKFYFRLPKNAEGVSHANWEIKLVVGDKVQVKVIDIDFEKKRVSLSIKEAAKAEEATEEAAE